MTTGTVIGSNATLEGFEPLRDQHYNATAERILLHNPELMVLRVRPDGGVPEYRAGQYTTLGMGYWEPRLEGCQAEELKPGQEEKLIKRAYSISSSIIDEDGDLLDLGALPYLEFYIVLVRSADGPAPALTPRLFTLKEGDRLFVGPKVTGHYTLEAVQPGQDVVFMATGTGEAPHNAMTGELLRAGHTGQIVSVVCVRYKQDLAYLDVHEQLQRRYPNYRYITLTTREPENLDPNHPDYIGKQYIQHLVESGQLEEQLGKTLDPTSAHVFLCGNPAMIGIPETPKGGERTYPEPTGVIEILERRGFRADERNQPGNIHFEKYW